MNDPKIKVTGRELEISQSTRKRNPHLYATAFGGDYIPPEGGEPPDPLPPRKTRKRIRQGEKGPNKLERAALEYLKRTRMGWEFEEQAIRFRLANGLWYKPDIVCLEHHTCFEVKGPHAFRGGFENLKMAASVYPRLAWYLLWKENGKWCEQRVLP